MRVSNLDTQDTQLTHWGRVTHICVSKLTTFGSDNGLSPGRRQAIIRTIAGILLIGPLRLNFSEFVIKFNTFLLKKMHLKMSSAKWRLFRLGLIVWSCRLESTVVCLVDMIFRLHSPILSLPWVVTPNLSLKPRTDFLHRFSNSIEISLCSHLDSDKVFAAIFTHGTTAVLSWHV